MMTEASAVNPNNGNERVLGLLLTVGGTPEPMVYAVDRTHPVAVVFVCSEQTQTTVVEIKRRLEELLPEGSSPIYKTLIVDDPANLIDCHRRVTEGLAYLRNERGLLREQIRIDFTGGTKAMSAAAVLAAAPDGYRFSYVSGAKRDKSGVGIVLSGSEQLSLPKNPWIVLEEPEVRRMLQMTVVGQWAAAQEIAGLLLFRATPSSQPVFRELARLIGGLAYWDRFEHQKAFGAWAKGSVPSVLSKLSLAAGYPMIEEFAKKCQTMTARLGELANARDKLTRNTPDVLVLDMLSNATRSAMCGNYDDASLRYYRSLELCVARRLRLIHKIDNDAVTKLQVPSPLKEDFVRRKGEPPQTGWMLAQYDCVQLLAALGDDVGKRLLDHIKQNRIDNQARNRNWLIHGDQHVSRASCESFRSGILSALGIAAQDIPVWPDFRP